MVSNWNNKAQENNDLPNVILLLSMAKSFHEELENKYDLLPSAEQQNLLRFIDIEKLLFKHIKHALNHFKHFAKILTEKDIQIQSLQSTINQYKKLNDQCLQ